MTPNCIMGVMPAGKRQDGFNPDAAPKWHIRDVDAETLAEQCDKFRAEIFSKAGKIDQTASSALPSPTCSTSFSSE